jgi:SAM-dependent methyltransferase
MPTRPRPEPPARARRRAARAPAPDRHLLYTPAVQSVDLDLATLEDLYRKIRGRTALRLREDFCGSAAMACAWAARGPRRRAIGVDLDRPTLAWARRHRLPPLAGAARRVTLVHADVRTVHGPPVDIIAALNYSYWVFRRRDVLLGYFRRARRSLARGGLLVLDAFGGTGAAEPLTETRRIPASRGPGGERIPAFGYTWEQSDFNPVDHRLRSHIHFRLAGGRVMRRAFSYDWRMWTLPELRELLAEAGFRASRVYVQDWDDRAHEPLASYTWRERFENQIGWLAYVVGIA